MEYIYGIYMEYPYGHEAEQMTFKHKFSSTELS